MHGRFRDCILTVFSLDLGNTKPSNIISGWWHDEWPLDTCDASLIFWSQRDLLLQTYANNPVWYCRSNDFNSSLEVLLDEHVRSDNVRSCAPHPYKWCSFVPSLILFVTSSDGQWCILQIFWILSPCMQRCTTMNIPNCRLYSRIPRIPLFL